MWELFLIKKITQSYDVYLKEWVLGWDTFDEKDNLDKYAARVDRGSFTNSKPCIDVYGNHLHMGTKMRFILGLLNCQNLLNVEFVIM